MIECYSNNLSVNTNEAVNLINTSLKKGDTVSNSGATIQFNRCGIYELCLNATGVAPSSTDEAPADLSLEVRKNGVAQASVSASATGATNKNPMSLTTLIQVPQNNSCNMCTSPTTCTIVNTGVPATYDTINVVVTKLV